MQAEEFALSVQSIASNALKPMDVQHAKTLITLKTNNVRPALRFNTASLAILKDNVLLVTKGSTQAEEYAFCAHSIAKNVLRQTVAQNVKILIS